MSDVDINKKISFNGINGSTGAYLFDALSSKDLARVAEGNTLDSHARDKAHVAELAYKAAKESQDPDRVDQDWAVKEGVDASKVEEAGWAIIWPQAKPKSELAARQAAIREALSPLLALRRAQATRINENYYKEYSGPLGYKEGESKQQYLARLGAGPGPADPDKVPYYLLIVASPEQIPFRLQYQIDVQYAVGRIHFETLDEYANYARSVVAAETQSLGLSRELACVGVANPDDAATQMSRKNLVAPLADAAETWVREGKEGLGKWAVSRYFDDRASKAQVRELFGGPKTPALLFTASHGMGFDLGDKRQEADQGALLLQDWPGPKQWKGAIGEELYLSGDDLGSEAGMLGTIAFNFACYGGGTPRYDEFSRQAFKDRKTIAERPFVSGLHRKMLSHPKGGALACLGHVERAWGYSFMWGTGKRGHIEPQLAVFESTLEALMKGKPVGLAFEYFNVRYAELASDLAEAIDQLDFNPDYLDPYSLAGMWTSNNDARGYAIFGDPAVRLCLDEGGESQARESIDLTRVGADTAPLAGPGPAAPEPDQADSPRPRANDEPVDYGLFGRKHDQAGSSGEADEDPGAAPEPGRFEALVRKIANTLGDAVEDFTTLEVRTYVSSDTNATAAVDRETLASEGDLRAFTRIQIDGDMDVIVPQTEGKVDAELWQMHLEFVKQAQAVRAQTLQTVLSLFSTIDRKS